jgi:hypothetical protein
MGKVLPKIFLAQLNRDIAFCIREALRTDFRNMKAAATGLAEQGDVSMETLKKWYNGCNTPSVVHLIVLARASSAVRRVLEELMNGNHPTETGTPRSLR